LGIAAGCCPSFCTRAIREYASSTNPSFIPWHWPSQIPKSSEEKLSCFQHLLLLSIGRIFLIIKIHHDHCN
jgi:hypothetical protein